MNCTIVAQGHNIADGKRHKELELFLAGPAPVSCNDLLQASD
jgi:hypothetical protein